MHFECSLKEGPHNTLFLTSQPWYTSKWMPGSLPLTTLELKGQKKFYYHVYKQVCVILLHSYSEVHYYMYSTLYHPVTFNSIELLHFLSNE